MDSDIIGEITLMQMDMVNRPRQIQMLEVLREEPAALVRDLAARLSVSESTIRRDLDALKDLGLVRRLYGGVVLENQTYLQQEPPFEIRQISHKSEKDGIGQIAAGLISDGDIIFIDGGTTTQSITPHLLNHKDQIIVTCGLNIVNALAGARHVTTIAVGGELHVASQSFVGSLGLEMLEAYRLRCDWAFIGAGGVSADHGITNRILDRIPLKRKAIEISRNVVLVADGSKVGLVTLGFVAPISVAHYIITDDSAPASELEAIAALGVQVKVASNG